MELKLRMLALVVSAIFSVCFSATVQAAAQRAPWQSAQCTAENMKVRKEWGDIPQAERKAYTDAVLCLQSKPSQMDPNVYPGAKSRYDDFVAVHINQTLRVHLDAIFLSWHRNYIFLYEQALAEECGYKGVAPYWDWPKWASNLHASPLFDGSEYSLSGDGTYNASLQPYVIGPNATLPRGSGGGCVASGPFKNYTATMGPFQFGLVFQAKGVLPSWSFDYNPRCFSRDLNTYVAGRYTNQSDVDALVAATSIEEFQNILSGVPGTLNLGPHGGGHLSMGAQGFDFFASPTDPAFFLHHGQIDRLWWQWQMKDPQNRIYGDNALYGTGTILNIPPSPNTTLTDFLDFQVLGQKRQVKELMSAEAGPFCYRYQDPSA